MSGYREAIRLAVYKSSEKIDDEEKEKKEEQSVSENVADRLLRIFWPERALEVKRQRAIQQVEREAEQTMETE